MLYLFKYLFKKDFYIVFHQDSPGIKVLVKRNKIQNFFYSKHFSMIGEKHHDTC